MLSRYSGPRSSVKPTSIVIKLIQHNIYKIFDYQEYFNNFMLKSIRINNTI